MAILGKLGSGFLLFKEKQWVRWAVGLAMIPRGEMGLIFAEVGKTHNIIDSNTYAALILVITATTLLAPFAMRLLYTRHEKVLKDFKDHMSI
jgi:Kef-type K+ transport system membrane component KefB